MPSTHLGIHLLRIVFRRTFRLVNDYGAPAGARSFINHHSGGFRTPANLRRRCAAKNEKLLAGKCRPSRNCFDKTSGNSLRLEYW
jgi:hypothetical protein